MIGPDGLALIREFEGLELKAYPDPATGGAPWTIGYGHTKGVREGDTCTPEEADEWLLEDVAEAETCIENCVDVELTQGEYDALCSFIFNLGCRTFRNSSVLRYLNQGNRKMAVEYILKYDKAAGRQMDGLTRRRKAEAELFERGA